MLFLAIWSYLLILQLGIEELIMKMLGINDIYLLSIMKLIQNKWQLIIH